MSANAPTSIIEINGLKTNHTITGSGDPVLLLHGWGANLQLLWKLAAELAKKGYRVHALDLPGFGESDFPPAAWTVHDYVQFVLAYMDSQNLTSNVHLFGHSFGGRLAIVLGAEYANRFNKIILCDAAGVKPRTPLHKQLPARMYKSVKKSINNESILGKFISQLSESYRQRVGSADYLSAGELKETFLAVIAEDLLPLASKISRPTLLLWGANDQDTPLWQAQALEKAIPDAGLVVFQGAGHYSYLDALPNAVRIMDYFFTHDN